MDKMKCPNCNSVLFNVEFKENHILLHCWKKKDCNYVKKISKSQNTAIKVENDNYNKTIIISPDDIKVFNN